MPFAGYKDFAACLADQRRRGKSEESAKKICGHLKAAKESRMTTTHLTRLHEAVFQEESLSKRIDRESGIIRGVKVLGMESANGRRYPIDLMRQYAHLYDGVKVNIDHPQRQGEERSYTSGFGELRKPVVRESGLFADLHYNRKHDRAEQVLEDCERFPTNFGLSHNAEGEVRIDDGKQVVESLAYVESVDIVGQPATNVGIWESRNSSRGAKRQMPKKTVERIIEDAPKGILGLVGLLENVEQGMMQPTDIVEVPPEPDPEAEVKAAIEAAILSAFRDEGLDLKATMDRIKKILKAHEDIVGPVGGSTSTATETSAATETSKETSKETSEGGGESTSETPGSEEEKKKVTESLMRRLSATEALAHAGVQITEARVKSLMNPELTDRERTELAESWAGNGKPETGGRPRTSPRKFGAGGSSFRESVEAEGGFAKAIK